MPLLGCLSGRNCLYFSWSNVFIKYLKKHKIHSSFTERSKGQDSTSRCLFWRNLHRTCYHPLSHFQSRDVLAATEENLGIRDPHFLHSPLKECPIRTLEYLLVRAPSSLTGEWILPFLNQWENLISEIGVLAIVQERDKIRLSSQ